VSRHSGIEFIAALDRCGHDCCRKRDQCRGQEKEKVGQVKTAVAVAHPCEHCAMIEPDNAGIAKRRKERDVAGPLRRQLFQQLAGRMLRPHDFRHQKRDGIESTLSLNVSSRSVSDKRTCGQGESSWSLAARRFSCLVVFIGFTRR
jgi:hypothetical protein